MSTVPLLLRLVSRVRWSLTLRRVHRTNGTALSTRQTCRSRITTCRYLITICTSWSRAIRFASTPRRRNWRRASLALIISIMQGMAMDMTSWSTTLNRKNRMVTRVAPRTLLRKWAPTKIVLPPLLSTTGELTRDTVERLRRRRKCCLPLLERILRRGESLKRVRRSPIACSSQYSPLTRSNCRRGQDVLRYRRPNKRRSGHHETVHCRHLDHPRPLDGHRCYWAAPEKEGGKEHGPPPPGWKAAVAPHAGVAERTGYARHHWYYVDGAPGPRPRA